MEAVKIGKVCISVFHGFKGSSHSLLCMRLCSLSPFQVGIAKASQQTFPTSHQCCCLPFNQLRQERCCWRCKSFTGALTLSIALPSLPLTDCEAQSGELGLSRTLDALLICLCPCFSWVCSYLMFYWQGGSCCTQRQKSYLPHAAGKAQEESRKKLPMKIQKKKKKLNFHSDLTLINSSLARLG